MLGRSCDVAVSKWEADKAFIFESLQTGSNAVLRGRSRVCNGDENRLRGRCNLLRSFQKMICIFRGWEALTMRFAKKNGNTTRLKCCACHAKKTMLVSKVLRCPGNATHPLKTTQQYCACHTERLLTR